MQKQQLLLMCRSLTYAQRSARTLERKGVTAVVTRAPKAAVTRGCGYCVSISPRNRGRALAILREAGLSPERILLRDADGSIREAGDDLS